MNNNKVLKINYEETDKKINVEIYGLIFEINEKVMEDLDVDELKLNGTETEVENVINQLLGDGSVEKINKKRENDGYEKMNLSVAFSIIVFLVNTYVNTVVEPINKVADNFQKTYDKINNFNGYNSRYRKGNRYRYNNRRY